MWAPLRYSTKTDVDGLVAEIADALTARVVEVSSAKAPTFAILRADGALAAIVRGHQGSCRIERVDGGTRVVRFTQGWDPDI